MFMWAGLFSDNAFKITPGGVITEIIDANADGVSIWGLKNASGIAVDGSGNVYVTGTAVSSSNNNAFKITPAGVVTVIIEHTGDGAGNTLASPQSITVDGSSNVYLAGASSHNVFKITPGGVITETIDATGDGAGNTFSDSFSIAVDGFRHQAFQHCSLLAYLPTMAALLDGHTFLKLL